MEQTCFYTKNNLHNSKQSDLPIREDEDMLVLRTEKKFRFRKWNYILTFCLAMAFSSSLFAIDLNVTGISGTYSDANGIYHSQGILARSGVEYWKHESKEYYIYYDEYQTGNGWYYWYLDIDTDDENSIPTNGTITYSDEDPSTVSPAGIVMYDGFLIDGTKFPMTIAEYSTIPEINIMGNGISISIGNATPSLSNYTKFGSANSSGGSASRIFTIQNTGSVDPLTVGTISFSGTNASDFTVTSAPSSTVNASSETSFTVTFTPTGVGDRTATILIDNNDSNEDPYTFAISGYGFTPKNLVVSGSTNPSDLNGTYTYQGIKNDFQYWKHSTLDYYIWSNSSSWIIDNNFLSSDGFPFYSISEANMPTGLTWSTNSFLPTGGSSYFVGAGTVTVSEEVAVPEINVKVGTFTISDGTTTTLFYKNTNFGSLEVASVDRAKSFTIENTGNATLTLPGVSPYVTITGTNASDFSVTTIPSNSISASATTTLGITFNPSAVGTRTATVVITSNDDDEAEYTFAIQGEGVTPRNLIVSNITAPSAANGTYIYQGILNEFQYWKHSTENYYIFNSPYNSTDPVWYIDVDQSAILTTPSSYNFYSQTDYASPVSVPNWTGSTGNSGTPTIQYSEPEMNVTGNSATITDGDVTASIYDHTDFGYTDITGGTVVHTFTIQNTGTENLTLTGTTPYVVVGGADASYFTVTSVPSASIADGGSTTFNVTFDPDAIREFNATLSIANNDATENPYNFSIKGTGSASPTITTQAVSSITTTTATGNGNITDLGSSNPTAYGVCWNTTGTPTTSDNKVDKGAASVTGAFTTSMTGLTVNTTYYVRAFAVNMVGTSYGTEVTFKTKATPVITWSNPSEIEYGTPLSVTQLNATANTPGTFTYTPVLGTKLNAGNGQTLQVDFTPTDLTNYEATSKTVTINVAKATPVITWSNPTGITYGTLLSATQLNATADVAGSMIYTPAVGTILNAGAAQDLKADFTPTDAANYNTASKTVTIDVAKATPIITWSNPTGITYGTLLSATQLNANADVAGSMVYTPAIDTKLNAGAAQDLKADFTPADAANYNTSSKTVTIDVAKATPVITWSNPTGITYGNLLSATQLNATADVAGSMVYTPAEGTKLNAGAAQDLKADFTPTDATNYNTASKTVTIDVAKATPLITWSNPADINNETALSSIQLNAIADVAGIFTYTPAIGIKLNVGDAQALNADFEPTDAVNYESASKTVYINVFLATGISEVGTNKLVIFPNPVIDFFSVSGIEGRAKISLSDLNGRLMLTKEISNNEMISLSTFLSGIYVVTLEDINGFTSRTILKK